MHRRTFLKTGAGINIAITAAGTMPPMNIAATDTLVMEPTISIAMLGGMVSPMMAEAARTAAPSGAP
jgi:hypothetical protein